MLPLLLDQKSKALALASKLYTDLGMPSRAIAEAFRKYDILLEGVRKGGRRRSGFYNKGGHKSKAADTGN